MPVRVTDGLTGQCDEALKVASWWSGKASICCGVSTVPSGQVNAFASSFFLPEQPENATSATMATAHSAFCMNSSEPSPFMGFLWDALPRPARAFPRPACLWVGAGRSEEHTSELQSRLHLVCRLLLEKKNKK